MNISEIEKSGYACFRDIESKRLQTSQVNAVRYIKQLAGITQTNIGDWNILSVFKRGDSNEVLTDKAEINKRFFDEIKKPRASYNMPDSWLNQLTELENVRRVDSTQALERRYTSKLTDTLAAHSTYMIRLREAAAISNQIDAIKNYRPNYKEEIKRIVESGFWEFVGVADSFITMKTTNEILLTYYVKKHGINSTINLGRYFAKYSPRTGDIYVWGADNNTSVEGYVHPHCGENSRPCFGEINEAITNASAQGQLEIVFDGIQKVLTSYYDGNPYKRFDQFEEKIKIREKKAREEEELLAQLSMSTENSSDQAAQPRTSRTSQRARDSLGRFASEELAEMMGE